MLGQRFVAFHQIAQFIFRARVQQVERVVFKRGVDAGIRRQRATTLGQRGPAQVLQFMQRGELGLEILLQRALGVGRDISLGRIQAQRRDRGDHDHHRGRKPCPEPCDFASMTFACFDHGKSTRIVSPLFSATGFASVVLLSIHALSV